MKKNLLVFLVAIGSFISHAQEIKWMTFNEALEAQKKTPKPIFMDVFTDWCGPCKMLDKNTFQNPAVADYVNKNYYAVKFNAEGTETIKYKALDYANPSYNPAAKGRNATHQFTTFLNVRGYPSMYILDSEGEIKNPIVGYHTPEQLLPLLK
jgi:thioredoxin-related protein